MHTKKERIKRPGFIYVVTNDCYVKVTEPFTKKKIQAVKIGRSTDYATRVGNMSASVFEDYRWHLVLHAKKDVAGCEDDIHGLFKDRRIETTSGSLTEFFKCPIDEVIKRIHRFVSRHNDEIEVKEDHGVKGLMRGRVASVIKKNIIKQGGAKAKAMASTFKVEFPDGEVIESPIARDVFVRTIKKFGPRRVADLGYKSLVGRSEADFGSSNFELKKIGKWYVSVHSSTDSKMQKIKSIAKKLGVAVTVTKVPGKKSS